MFFKARLSAILVIAAFMSFSSCKKGSDTPSTPAPVANFSYSGAGLAPSTVSFSNSSTNATSYSWDFGDNGTSTQASPTHTYTRSGVFTVKLTATGSGGTNTTTKTVNISAPTSAKITGVKVVQMPFTNSSGGGWDNNSGPDVSFTITAENDNVLYTHPTYLPDATSSSLPISFTLATPFQISSFTTTYKVKLYDYDGNDVPPNADDFVGGYSFSLAASAQAGYPTTVTLFATGSNVKIDLTLQWQ
jgi:PKD repeat protein